MVPATLFAWPQSDRVSLFKDQTLDAAGTKTHHRRHLAYGHRCRHNTPCDKTGRPHKVRNLCFVTRALRFSWLMAKCGFTLVGRRSNPPMRLCVHRSARLQYDDFQRHRSFGEVQLSVFSQHGTLPRGVSLHEMHSGRHAGFPDLVPPGFSQNGSLTHACRRWAGKAPSELRHIQTLR